MKNAMNKQRINRKRSKKDPIVLLPILLIILLWSGFASARNGRAQSPFQVGLVVQLNGETITRCVTLNKERPTGYDVLAESGLDLITSSSGMGVTVCSIQGIGCPASDCFCQSYTAPYYYWSYWHLQNENWVYSNLGVSNYNVSPQGVEGWIWGDGKKAPPNISFASICPPVTATATLSATPAPTNPSTATLPPVRKTRNPSATLPIYVTPVVTDTPLPPTSFVPSQTNAPISPSPTVTITLAYAVQVKASSAPNLTNFTPMPPSPTEAYNINAISLTATAIVLDHQHAPAPTLTSNFLSPLIKTGFLAFLGMAGVILLLFILVLLRVRK